MLFEKRVFVDPDQIALEIAGIWGPGCVIETCSIVEGIYHIFGSWPTAGGEPAKAMWVLDPHEKTISIHPILPIARGGKPIFCGTNRSVEYEH